MGNPSANMGVTQERGYHVMYREHVTNFCPGCSRSNWYIGRAMAECAFCQTALPLELAGTGSGTFFQRGKRRVERIAA